MLLKEHIPMNTKVTFSFDEKDSEGVKKLAEKLDIAQADIFRTAIKLILKMKVADQKALFKRK